AGRSRTTGEVFGSFGVLRCHPSRGDPVALKVEVEAAEAGFDAVRLQRIGSRLRRYVDDGLLPGWTFVLARYGQIVLLETYGQRDIGAGDPVEVDTIFRAYSMTKPLTSVAALLLWEQGANQLEDAVSACVRSFSDARDSR